MIQKDAPVEPEDDRTVVVGRPESEADETIIVSRGSDDGADRTVVVSREAVVDADETIVVSRRPDDASDSTVVVARSGVGDPDETIVVARGANDSDKTAVAGRDSRRKPTSRAKGPRGRRRIALPPVDPGFTPEVVVAAGPGAVQSYAPRKIPPPPGAAAPIELGEEATRAPAPQMPSVRRASKRMGVVAVAGFAVSCAVSVAGLTALIVAIVGG